MTTEERNFTDITKIIIELDTTQFDGLFLTWEIEAHPTKKGYGIVTASYPERGWKGREIADMTGLQKGKYIDINDDMDAMVSYKIVSAAIRHETKRKEASC